MWDNVLTVQTSLHTSPSRALLSLSAILLLSAGCATTSSRPVVQTESGAVQGVLRNGAIEYRGIPFAAQPVRWALPQPPAAWSGVRDATGFGNACPQARRYDLTEASNAEDCLTVNVSTSPDLQAGEKLPVLFWIHGGAYVGGSSNLYRLDRLATRGRMVVVTANYRVGIFGFMPVKGIDADFNGDLGLEDQRYAMRWVQRNIAAFGGDPNNVTMGGESAGGGSVCMHLASPDRVRGLFHKAILQSSGCLQTLPTLAGSLDESDPANPPLWKKIATEVGCDKAFDKVACLRAAPVEEMVSAGQKLGGGLLMPVVGSGTVPVTVATAVKSGNLVKVPILAGSTRDELRLYVAYFKLYAPFITDFSEATLRSAWLPAFYGADSPDPGHPGKTRHESILKEYFPAGGADGASLGSMLSDYQTVVGINDCLGLWTSDAFLPLFPAIFQSEFADPDAPVLGVGIAKGMDPGFALGAVHSSELNYYFPNLSNTSAIDAPDLKPASQGLADQMVGYWAAFMATGSPTAPGLPAWPRYAGGGTGVLVLQPGAVAPSDSYARHRCAFWRGLYP